MLSIVWILVVVVVVNLLYYLLLRSVVWSIISVVLHCFCASMLFACYSSYTVVLAYSAVCVLCVMMLRRKMRGEKAD